MPGLFSLAVVALLVGAIYGPVYRELTIFGVFRTPSRAVIAEDQSFYKIEDTVHCEDLHHYANRLFAACEDSSQTRFGWFPPMVIFTQTPQSTGSIHVIDPQTMKSTRLGFENFSGSFVTHGIDVTQDPDSKDAVYIFAVNHLPNPDFDSADANGEDNPQARSQVELFHHVLGSSTARHVRSIQHPLIKTPNDIYADGPSSFYVTNDHCYREGIKRQVEDILPAAKWSSIVHVQINNLESADGQSGFDATVSLSGLHNNNGLGHGGSDDEMVITSALGGTIYLAKPNDNNHTITISESIPLDSLTDNPSYFMDPYATPSNDASGYLVAGLARPIDLPTSFPDPTAKDGVMVWHVRPNSTSADGSTAWEKRLIFEDDGSHIRTASAAVLVGIEPRPNEGKKAWLFVTGFLSESVIAVEVEL